MTIEYMVRELRSNKWINERKFGNISSFSIKRKVFYNGLWDEQTIKARGLFINTNTMQIVARSYDKFFNIGERIGSRELHDTLKFPVRAYVKENGFLGLIGYDSESDSLFITSKSTPESPFADMFIKILNKEGWNHPIKEKMLKTFLRNNNCTLVFEVIDPTNDPHMIKYSKPMLILLDVVYNEPVFRKMNYTELLVFAYQYGFLYKTIKKKFDTWEDFYSFYEENEENESEEIEGYVFEDSNGFMIKHKMPYYAYWRFMRTCKDRIIRSREMENTNPYFPDASDFLQWAMEQDTEVLKKDIITLREMFEWQNAK